MRHSITATRLTDSIGSIRTDIAESMVGKTVDLMVDSRTLVHGIVASVFIMAGSPKIIVEGSFYDLDQVLTVTP